MKPITREWVEKAEGDFSTGSRELRARKDPNYDGVCFHSQQCSEKYLKALLQELDIPFSKTHNLIALLDLLSPPDAQLELLKPEIDSLNAFAVIVRYPGESANREKAKKAMNICKEIRRIIRLKLGLK
jgi:HEPN domain-containing protein